MKRLVVVLVVLALVLINGCAGHIRESLKTDDNGATYAGSNLNLLGPPPAGPEAMARAYAIKKGTDAMEKGQFLSSRLIIIGFVNNDSQKTAIIYHPEIPGYRIKIAPGGDFAFMQVHNLPKEIVLYHQNGDIAQKLKPDPANIARIKVVNGIKVDVLFTINRL